MGWSYSSVVQCMPSMRKTELDPQHHQKKKLLLYNVVIFHGFLLTAFTVIADLFQGLLFL